MRRFGIVALGAGASALGVAVWAAKLAIAATSLPIAQPLVATGAYQFAADTVVKGETLSQIFARHEIAGSDMEGVLASTDALSPRHLRPGLIFAFRQPYSDAMPDRVDVRLDYTRFLHLTRVADQWTGTVETIVWTPQMERVEGTIHTSLEVTLQAAVPDSVLPAIERKRFIWDLADNVFPWQIDFSRDLAEGDAFSILFERTTSALGDVRYGRLVAARIQSHKVTNTAYVVSDSTGANAYYDADGRSLRRTFRRSPVEYRRISSGFSMARLHPILNITRPHLGVDYAAVRGTPILATADGVVKFAGPAGDDGIMVKLRHPGGVETLYAHMDRIEKDIRVGLRVQQDKRIGYVGSTGLANGPHVHYEFIKNGHPVNPRAVDLGNGQPLPDQQRATFAQLRAHFDHLLEPSPPAPPATGAPSGN